MHAQDPVVSIAGFFVARVKSAAPEDGPAVGSLSGQLI
jgi:hypothetical protein